MLKSKNIRSALLVWLLIPSLLAQVDWTGTWYTASCNNNNERSCCPPVGTTFYMRNDSDLIAPINYIAGYQQFFNLNLSACAEAYSVIPANISVNQEVILDMGSFTSSAVYNLTSVFNISELGGFPTIVVSTNDSNSLTSLAIFLKVTESPTYANCWSTELDCYLQATYLCVIKPCSCVQQEEYSADNTFFLFWCVVPSYGQAPEEEEFYFDTTNSEWTVEESCAEACCCPVAGSTLNLEVEEGLTFLTGATWSQACTPFLKNFVSPIYYNMEQVIPSDVVEVNSGQIITMAQGSYYNLALLSTQILDFNIHETVSCGISLVQDGPPLTFFSYLKFYIWPCVSTAAAIWMIWDTRIGKHEKSSNILKVLRYISFGDVLISNLVLVFLYNESLFTEPWSCSIFVITPVVGTWFALYWTTVLPIMADRARSDLTFDEDQFLFRAKLICGIVCLLPFIRFLPWFPLKLRCYFKMCITDNLGPLYLPVLYSGFPLAISVPVTCYYYAKQCFVKVKRFNKKLIALLWYPLTQIIGYSTSFILAVNFATLDFHLGPNYVNNERVLLKFGYLPGLWNCLIYILLIRKQKNKLGKFVETKIEGSESMNDNTMENNEIRLKEALII